MYKKNTFAQGDRIYATLTLQGNKIAEIQNNNITGIDDVIRRLKKLANQYSGISKIYIRNMTQGWATQVPLMLCTSLLQIKSREQLVREGYCESNGQLLLQF